ncbi:RHS repeat-associated core domain-containing protein [Enterobacter cloacae]|uniref:RHS repeat-associated core domain-containing protein n=1 Tax=Enterobacter cloacae TaxID=550 RepID=UPI0021D043C4|nr:RHS repeat domain-containing protein [Enterobacter cloacae]MCU6209278.1 RHS repeat protein [Enterobacter cloacae]
MHIQDHENHNNTPVVTVLDNRGLGVRDIAYYRHPDTLNVTDVRISRHRYNARGFMDQSCDPRLYNRGMVNFTCVTDLHGTALCTQGGDNGVILSLKDVSGRSLISLSNIGINEEGAVDRNQMITRLCRYEENRLAGRLLSVEERVGSISRITERFGYAGNTATEKDRNLAGVSANHYDTAGLLQTGSVALTGIPVNTTRRLLKDADNPELIVDWQGADDSAWNELVAEENEGHVTITTADATGAILTATDAKGNLQRLAYDVAGGVAGSWLTVKDSSEKDIIKSLTYSANGQILSEIHGNGVVTTYIYEATTQRLIRIKTERPAGHSSGAKVLQDLCYEYDPTGNVLKVRNDSEETTYWRNQKVVPENTYIYDSLYQLVRGTGREMANAGQLSSSLQTGVIPPAADNSVYTLYSRTYTYDLSGNLTRIRHYASATNHNYTKIITVSDHSNRGVLSTLTDEPMEVDTMFTAGGLQLQLLPGQTLSWTTRNELLSVTPIVREGDANDGESYRYDGGSRRILKVCRQRTGNNIQVQRVVYLPGLELRTSKKGETETEGLQVITMGEVGRSQLRILHWDSGIPEGIDNNQIRYSYGNLAGSSQLELDAEGNITSTEEYYPYGGTAAWAARNQVETDNKTVRYSGKERDATGLYYYGYRYYQPWTGRWLSADPAGVIDGLNLYRMCRNNPVRYVDYDGCKGKEPAFNTLLSLTKKLWDTPDVSREQVMQNYHAMSLSEETEIMSTEESLTQIMRMQEIADDAGRNLTVYPQGRRDTSPMQLYLQSGARLSPPDGSIGYYRFIAAGANRRQPAKSRLNITVKKSYISETARAIAKLTMKNVTLISQSKVTAYDYVGKVAESAVVYLNTQSEVKAREIKDKFLHELSQTLHAVGVDVMDALVSHPAVSMMELEKGIHYKQISEKDSQSGQGSIAKGVSGIVTEAINYGKQMQTVSPKKALRHVLREWGYSRSNPALVRASAASGWLRGKTVF